MDNYNKYKQAFAEAFEAEPEAVESFVFRKVEAWDSIGHMSLIAELEGTFDVEFEPYEIMDITSFQAGIEVLKRKGIEF